MATLTEDQAQLFLEKNYGVATTLRRDGSPHSTVVWVDWDGECVLFNTREGRAKPRHLRSDPRVAVAVIDANNPYRWISVSGTAELVTEGAVEHIDELALRYRGRTPYGVQPGEQRIIVRVRLEHVTAYGVE